MRDAAAEAVRSAGIVLERGREAGSLLDLIGKARIVLLGEATHGTQEFYRVRADVTHELITRRGFNIVAVERRLAGLPARQSMGARLWARRLG
jgi:erythromycin esterase-like protein